MSDNKPRKKDKDFRSEILFADIALIILGILMIIFEKQIATIICVAVGIILGIWGIIRLVSYFAADKDKALSSFGLVQGVALLCFGIFFIFSPDTLASFLSVILAIILIIAGIMKLQYAVDLMRLKSKTWMVPMGGAVISVAMGIIIFFNPTVSWLMLFIGIALIITALWDMLSVVLLTRITRKLNDNGMIDVEVTDDDTTDYRDDY